MLHMHEAGPKRAPTIVFLHAIGSSGWMWLRQLDNLSDFHCIVPDLPGHGQSRQQPWISLAATAREVAEVIKHRATHGRAHIVGLSLGSYVGLELMSCAGQCVDHAILSGLNVLPLPNLAVMKLLSVALLPVLKTDRMIRINARALRVPDDQYVGFQQAARQVSRRAYFKASGDAGRFRLPANAASLTSPTLLVAGEQEHSLIHQSLITTRQALPNAQAYLAPGGGHGWSGERPQLFAQMIRAWITDEPLPPELRLVA